MKKSKLKEYRIWQQVRDRCHNENNKCYPRYGGRGITVCDRWNPLKGGTFENFIEDMGLRPVGGEKMTIERLDTNGNYEPSNCVWATWKTQARNTSRNNIIDFNGESLPMSEWAERLGISRNVLYERLKTWTVERALTTPKISKFKSLH